MNVVELKALSPLLVLAGAGTLTLLLAAFLRRPAVIFMAFVVGLLAFLGAVYGLWPSAPVVIAGQLRVDDFTLLFWALLGLATLVLLVFNQRYYRRPDGTAEETFGLLMLAALGACVLVAAQHFASFFMGLELLSVVLFILIAWQCLMPQSIEGGIKYLVLAGLATGFMLFGMALVFATSGTLSFPALEQLPAMPATQAWWLAGLALLLVGVLFKLSLVPFHFWTPDVYQGAPLPVTAFLATVSKVAVLGLLLRVAVDMDLTRESPLWAALAVVAGASMLAGNWLALLQDDLKRLLAWSSVAHMGYALTALLVGGALAAEAVVFYCLFYLATTLLAFGVLVGLSRERSDRSPRISDLAGLHRRRPLAALAMMLAMLSLAGVPLTGGFVGKFYVLAAGAAGEFWLLMALVIAGSAIGLFYYMRVVLALFGDGEPTQLGVATGRGVSLSLVLLALAVLWLGILPQDGMELARQAAADLLPLDTLVAGRAGE